MSSVLLGAVVLLQATINQGPASGPDRRAEYREAFSAIKVPVLVDLAGLEDSPRKLGSAAGTVEGASVLAASLRRQVLEIGDALLFAQSREPGLGTRDGARLVTEWLAGERTELVQRLRSGPIDLRDVNVHGRLALANFLSSNDSLLHQLAKGESIQMGVAPNLVVRVPFDPGERPSRWNAYLTPGVTLDHPDLDYREPDDPTPRQTAPLPIVNDGELDFGEGEVLRLQEIVDRAWQLWKSRYRLDARFLNQEVFVKGRFTARRFAEVMERHGRAIEYRTVAPEEDPMSVAHERKEELLHALLRHVSPELRKLYERGMQGPFTATVEELLRYDPAWRDELLRGTGANLRTVVTIERVTVRAFFQGNPNAVLPNSRSMPSTRIQF